MVNASIAACTVEWRHCYYDVTQAPLHYESSFAHTWTDRKSNYVISTNVHYVHLGGDNNRHINSRVKLQNVISEVWQNITKSTNYKVFFQAEDGIRDHA